jgi:8-oxo-dGTP pyrophosphatase MutT (NUDIX family)
MIKITSTGKIIRLISNYKLSEPPAGFISVEVLSAEEMKSFYSILIGSSEINEIRFYNKDENLLFEWFKSMFKIVEAAGGVVKNPNNEYLFIFRNGKWDLPKGKIEKNELVKDAAIREVEEECGISKLEIVKELPTTYHTYSIEDKAILKPTYWFEMSSSDGSKLVPQTEEGITDVQWIKDGDISKVRENTYGSILDLIEELK